MLSFSLLVSGMAPVPGDKNRCVRAANILSPCPSALPLHGMAPATRKRLRVRLCPHALSLLPFAPRASRHHSRNPTRAARAPTLPRNPEARRPPA